MDRPRTLVVPPGSTALLELCHAIDDAMALPRPAAERDEQTYLKCVRDRARLVRYAVKKLIEIRNADEDDVMAVVLRLRAEIGQLQDHEPGYQP